MKPSKTKSKSLKKPSPTSKSWLQRLVSDHQTTAKTKRRERSLSGSLERLEAREVLSGGTAPFGYLPIALASDQAGAGLIQDSNLQGAWGIALAPAGGPLWVADNAHSTASRYTGSVSGSPFAATSAVATPDGLPTGIVFNPTGSFTVGSGASSGPATFLIASQNGAIDGWSPLLNGPAVNVATTAGADFTGLAVATVPSGNTTQSLLFATDFKNGKIDVFDGNFQPTTLSANAFTDSSLPTGYAPYNIELIGNQLYVAYAKPDPANPGTPLAQAGNGVIDIYNLDGTLAGGKEFIGPGKLQVPYGMVMAPSTFGDFQGDLLVADAGSGQILAYDSSGTFQGTLNNGPGNTSPITIPGIRGLTFGNGSSSGAGNSTTLFYSASTGGHGAVGEILNAFDQPLVVVPATIAAAQGQAFSGVVATLADSNTSLTKDSFLAIINWGGNITSAGTVTPNGSGGFNIIGQHTYATAGTRQVTVTVSDQEATPHNVTATAVAVVTDPSFAPAGVTFTSTQNQAFSGSVGNFADPTGPGAASAYVATINWGDGSSSSPGNVTLTAPNTYSVLGGHTYTQVGSFSITATVSELNNGTALAQIGTIASTALVSDPNTLTAAGTTLDAKQGTSTSVTVATFTDTYAAATAGMFQATIDWGDGTSASQGSVSLANGTFTVVGTHAYVTNGPATVTVSISDTPGTATAVATSTANVADGNTFTPVAATFVAQSGQSFSGVVALFPDANPLVRAGDFTTTIDWGDGSTASLGSLTAANGTLTVSGTHTYATAGAAHAVAVTVNENSPGTATGAVTSTAVVPANDVTGSGGTITGTATTASSPQALATFKPNAGNTADTFTATVDWGDGTSFTEASVTTAGDGTFTVVGSHTYASPGTFTPDVIVYEATGTATATPAAAIAATATLASPVVLSPATITGTEHITSSYTVATFTDGGQPGATTGDFTATIDWGDGTSSSGGSISLNGGVFSVRGSHAFAHAGTHNVVVTVTDSLGTPFSNSVTSVATISDSDHFTTGTASLTATMGTAFNGPVAIFTDTDLISVAGDFSAVISWGDSQDTAGSVTGGNGKFTVSGQHTYALDGAFPLKVTIQNKSGLTGAAEYVATANATVMPGAGYAATGATVTATSGQTFTGTIATFTDTGTTHPSTDFSATINWGDGSTTTNGTVSGSNGNYMVSGSHGYAMPGTFAITVQITETAVTAVITATSSASVSDGTTLTPSSVTFSATAGSAFTGAVGTFTDTNTLATSANFTATIDWGDGAIDSGASVSITGGNGTFTVSGAHSYAHAGSNAVKVTLSEKSPGTVSATATSAASVTAGTITISGEVFNDVNFNGTLDSGEQGLAGITVFLNVDGSGKADGTNPQTTTDANGKFTLTTTSAGTYAVMEAVPANHGLALSSPIQALTLTAGQSVSGVNIGNLLTSTVVPLVVSTTPPAAAADANTAYINALYQDVLGRTPDTAGLAFWQQQLAAGATHGTVAYGFWVSAEHRARQIDEYFQGLLGRQEDVASQAAWVSNFTQNGAINQTAAIAFVTTPEFQASHAGNTAFVDALYDDILLRPADSAGESNWVGQLNSGAMTLDQVAKAFVYGTEASTRIVDALFSVFLHRAPNTASLNGWVGQLTSGALNADQVAIALLCSDEFFADVTGSQAPQFTSAAAAQFTAGAASTFAITTSGVPIGAITATGLPTGLTLTDNHDGTGTLTSGSSLAAGTYNFQLAVSNGVGVAAKQNFTLFVSTAANN